MNPKNVFNHSRKVVKESLADEYNVVRSRYTSPLHPEKTAETIATHAAWKCALISGAANLLSGQLGATAAPFTTFVIQKTQRQMLADLAAVYEKSPLTIFPQQSCFAFDQRAAKKASNAVVRFGRAKLTGKTLNLPNRAFKKVGGVSQTQIAFRYGLARCLPSLVAAAVGTFTYFETRKLAAAATFALNRKDRPNENK